MILKTIYQDDKIIVEIPKFLYRLFTSQKQLSIELINTAIKQLKIILEIRGCKIKKHSIKVGRQLLYLQKVPLLTLTEDFKDMTFMYDGLCYTQELIKYCDFKKQRLILNTLEDIYKCFGVFGKIYIHFFKEPIEDIDGFIACGDENLLRVLFISYEQS